MRRACVFGRKFYVEIMLFDTFYTRQRIFVLCEFSALKLNYKNFRSHSRLSHYIILFSVTDKLTHTFSLNLTPFVSVPSPLSEMAWTCRGVFRKFDLKHVPICDCIVYVQNNSVYSSVSCNAVYSRFACIRSCPTNKKKKKKNQNIKWNTKKYRTCHTKTIRIVKNTYVVVGALFVLYSCNKLKARVQIWRPPAHHEYNIHSISYI